MCLEGLGKGGRGGGRSSEAEAAAVAVGGFGQQAGDANTAGTEWHRVNAGPATLKYGQYEQHCGTARSVSGVCVHREIIKRSGLCGYGVLKHDFEDACPSPTSPPSFVVQLSLAPKRSSSTMGYYGNINAGYTFQCHNLWFGLAI